MEPVRTINIRSADRDAMTDSQTGPVVLHVITGLNMGGAETMLAKTIAHPALWRDGMRHEVLSLLRPGPVAERIRQSGTPIHTLDMRQGLPGPAHLVGLARIIRRIRPAIIHGWMYHGNLAATVGGMLAGGGQALMWNIRHSVANIAREPRGTRHVIRLGAYLSRRPVSIVYNSHAAARQHAELGYSPSQSLVIANGFDCDQFAPDPQARGRLRQMFGIQPEPLVVAMVARAHPMKSVETLAEAIWRARGKGHDIHLLLVGAGMDEPTPQVSAMLRTLPADRVTLSGMRQDVAQWLPGADMVALSSRWGEGFPNILGEAMASGVPCVTTNVGDAGAVVGNSGLVVPPGDPEAMAEAIGQLVRLGPEGRSHLGQVARLRAQEHFSLDHIAGQYADLYQRHVPASGTRALRLELQKVAA